MLDRDWPAACRFWEEARASGELNPRDWIDAGTSFREAGRFPVSEEILAQAIQRFPADAQIAIAQAWLANAQNNWPLALRRWQVLRVRFPQNPWCIFGNIHALRGAGKTDEIEPLLLALETLLVEARSKARDKESLLALEIEAAKARLDWGSVRSAVDSALADGVSPPSKAFLALAQACWHLHDLDAAERAATRALAADPRSSEAEVIRAMAATERGEGETALACYRRLAELNPATSRWSVKIIQLLNRLGHVPEAIAEAERLEQRWPHDPVVRMFLRNFGPASAGEIASLQNSAQPRGPAQTAEEDELRILAQRAPGPPRFKRPLAVLLPDQDVAISEASRSSTALLIFAGSNDAVSMPLPVFDRYLAVFPVTVFYLKDFNRLRFLRGIQSSAADYSSTIEGLRAKLSDLGISRVFALGNCDGGFGAIRYGVELGAESIVTFSTPTFSPDESLTRIEQARNFMRKRLAGQLSAEMTDLRGFLEARSHPSKIDLYFEEEDPRDRIQALHLDGLPGVTLHPQPGLSNHFLLRKLGVASDDFSEQLGRILGIDRPSAA